MILVTVGTEQYPFNALMSWVDVLIRYQFIDPDEEVIVQYGASTELPDNVKIYRRLPESKFRALIDEARLVIAHCGEGTALLLESLGKPYVLVPRTQRYGEHVDDHQLEMADAMEKQGFTIARSPGDLVRFLSAPKALRLASPDGNLTKALSACCGNPVNQKVMLVCSSGGHYKAMQRLKPFWQDFREISWVTFQSPTAEADLASNPGNVYWAHSPTNRNIPNLIRNLRLAFKVLKQERPDVVVSTGAGVAVPFLWLARFLCNSQVIFVESKTRLKKLSLSAKLLKVLGGLDQLVVQSRELADLYPDALFVDAATPAGILAAHSQNSQLDRLSFRNSMLLSTSSHLGAREGTILEECLKTLASEPPKQIVLDMGATRSIDGAGLGALFTCLRIAQSIGSKLVLWSVKPEVKTILTTARLDRLFTIEAGTQTLRIHATAEESVDKVATVKPNPIQRTIDIVSGSFGMVTMALLFIPIAIAIKLDSPGPVLSSQIRCGRMGKHFRIWKFRSTLMPTQPQAETDLLAKFNPQLTRFGRFLIKTNLDKLPLFWSILAGDMSLVGSRAPTTDEIECLSIPQWNCLNAKPGITGEWQAAFAMQEFEDIIELDSTSAV
jgi:anti-anti-sigma factor